MTPLIIILDLTLTCHFTAKESQTRRIKSCTFDLISPLPLLSISPSSSLPTVGPVRDSVSPFFACYGWNPKAHPDIPQRLGVNNPGCFEYLMDGKERCKYLQEQIREAQHRTVDQYNRKHKDIEFKVGDMVYINRRNWKTRQPTPKLDTRFAGPYPVQERIGRRAYQITLPANLSSMSLCSSQQEQAHSLNGQNSLSWA
ncbi:uncharacterized protein UDID_17641 [Ustilago sp. UG-2017a]|nr:uncharacterized protein UDID_17641 [Ustilago sp. UG-2017a]